MSAGPSLYRRHRPRTFAEVVGQEHVVRTLENAVTRGAVHHAYLFVGSRGTGKTSMAKILAACLNCVGGPTIEPCGECPECAAIASATSLDVIEMDAASSNSVDDIRALREAVAYAPLSGRHKVYILDEAHMLSTAAWNAFLKTLEEPPPNTIFVLATTDPQKVLPTVVDRCHRFDFQRPTAEQIIVVLRRAAAAESIEIPPDALALIARHAAGSFRDALGTLEQLATYSGSRIAIDDVLAVLGIADVELLFGIIDAIHAGNPSAALQAVAGCVDGGRDPAGVVRELEVHARELLVVQTLETVPAELAVTPERDQRLVEQADRVAGPALVRLLDLLAAALEALRAGADGRTQLELAVIKAADPATDATLAAALDRIARLEARLENDPAAGAPPAPRLRPAPPAAAIPPAPVPAPTPAGDADPPEGEPTVRAVQAEKSEAPVADAGEAFTLERLLGVWPAVVDTVRSSNALLGAVVADAQPVELVDRKLVLAFQEGAAFLRRKAEERANNNVLTDAVRTVTGQALSLAYELRVLAPGPNDRTLSEDEWVTRLKDEFDAEELAHKGGPAAEPNERQETS